MCRVIWLLSLYIRQKFSLFFRLLSFGIEAETHIAQTIFSVWTVEYESKSMSWHIQFRYQFLAAVKLLIIVNVNQINRKGEKRNENKNTRRKKEMKQMEIYQAKTLFIDSFKCRNKQNKNCVFDLNQSKQ